MGLANVYRKITHKGERMLTEQELTPYRASIGERHRVANVEDWGRLFGDPGPGPLMRHVGVFSLYVETATDYHREKCGEPTWFHFRWSVWSHGTLCAHGFAEHESRAMFMADRAVDGLLDRLRDLVRERMRIERPF